MLVAFSNPGPEEAADRRRLDARSLRRADRHALFRHRRDRRPADAAEAEERRQDQAGGCLGHADPRRARAATATSALASTTTAPSRSPSASLRQAMQDMPEIAELSKHVMIEETKQGLNIEIVDQNGSSMFPEGSKEPYERTRRLVQRLAAPLKTLPYRISISGHTAASKHAGAAGLRAMGAVGRPRQFGPQDSGGGGRADRQLLHGRRPGRHPAAVSRTIPSSRPIAASPSP